MPAVKARVWGVTVNLGHLPDGIVPSTACAWLCDRLRNNETVRQGTFQQEMGEAGNWHLQVAIRFTRQVRLAHVNKLVPGHAIPKDSSENNFKYCRKEESRCSEHCTECPHEINTAPVQQGKRTDIHNAVAAMKAGTCTIVLECSHIFVLLLECSHIFVLCSRSDHGTDVHGTH